MVTDRRSRRGRPGVRARHRRVRPSVPRPSVPKKANLRQLGRARLRPVTGRPAKHRLATRCRSFSRRARGRPRASVCGEEGEAVEERRGKASGPDPGSRKGAGPSQGAATRQNGDCRRAAGERRGERAERGWARASARPPSPAPLPSAPAPDRRERSLALGGRPSISREGTAARPARNATKKRQLSG